MTQIVVAYSSSNGFVTTNASLDESAMSAITETEIKVLELLTNEGKKTAPEIKNRINLSREHTARLMKKLYEKGYLERETGKIPYIYKIKKEMENILNSTRNSSS